IPLNGAEFRYLCTELHLSSAVLCKRLALTESELLEWESACRIPRHADTFIRIMYAVHLDRPERVKRLDSSTLTMNQKVYFVLQHTEKGWILQETLDQPMPTTGARASDPDPQLATDRDSLA